MAVTPADLQAENRALLRALTLAEETAAFASPNPTVGCVLLREGVTLGEGAHFYEDRDHAEIVALKAAAVAGHQVRGATACVTFEPCSHNGRTGPCADALIAAGIARCVVATIDPNPLVRGQGMAKLRNAGIDVDLLHPASPLAQRARRLNDAFAFSVQHQRPFVTLKAAISADGKLAPNPSQRLNRSPVWLTGIAARADVQDLRHTADALLTGIGTVLADNPQLTDRTGLPRRRPLIRVVLDSHLRIPADSALIRHAANDLLLVCNSSADPTRRAQLSAYPLELLALPALGTPAGLGTLLAHLHQRHIRSVLTEGGAGINGALLRAGLADRIILYRSSKELGPDAIPFAADGISPFSLQQQLTSTTQTNFPHNSTKDLRLTGYLHDPWSSVDLEQDL